MLAWTASASAADKVVLMLNWYVYGEHAPFYYGKDKGIYAAEGIDLEIQEGRGSAATTQAVAAKTADFGYVDVPTMMRAAVKGAPIIATGVRCRPARCRRWVLSRRTSRSPRTSRARRWRSRRRDSMTQIWPLFLKKTGLKESDFQTVAGDGQTKLNAVINGQADLLLGYVMDQSMKIKDATGKDVNAIKFADYGINMVCSGVVANTDLRQGQCRSGQALHVGDDQGGRSGREGAEGRRAVDPRRQPEGRQDRDADAGLRADDPAVPDRRKPRASGRSR